VTQLFSLVGKTALVTGGYRGLGSAIAWGLAQAGARVVLNGRSRAGVEEAVARFRAEGFDAVVSAFDVTDEAAVRAATTDLAERGWAIDILINNAGIARRGPLLETALADFEAVLRTNLTSAFVLSKALVPGMIERGGGKIINVASLMSDLARPTTGSYAAAKGGLKMLTRAMAAEWSALGVQVNAIAPGYFETELTRPLKEDAAFDRWLCSRTPSGRWGKPEELVGAAIFLASRASDYVCGQILVVDGGLTAVV
jgi:gluconate 5-dehydrogenase